MHTQKTKGSGYAQRFFMIKLDICFHNLDIQGLQSQCLLGGMHFWMFTNLKASLIIPTGSLLAKHCDIVGLAFIL